MKSRLCDSICNEFKLCICNSNALTRSLKREYSKIDFRAILKEAGITTEMLMPRKLLSLTGSSSGTASAQPRGGANSAVSGVSTRSGKSDLFANVPAYLPLHLFDNQDLVSRTPDEWLSLGYENLEPEFERDNSRRFCQSDEAAGSQDQTSRKPVPARALLPIRDDQHDRKHRRILNS